MPRDFFKEFKPERGDLIYGRSDVRDVYESKLDKDQLKAIAEGAWVRIDSYNDSAMIPALQTGGSEDDIRQSTLDFAAEADKGVGPKDVTDYSKALLSSRYTPLSTLTAPKEKLERENAGRPEGNRELLAIRRACKFGIEHVVTSHKGAYIHFAIDDIKMEDVVAQTTFGGSGRAGKAVPITTSELRAIYRNSHREEYKRRIIFYVKGEEKMAPWDENPNLWAKYGAARLEKYLKVLEAEKKRYENKYGANREKAKQLEERHKKTVQEYLQHKKFGRFNQAVDVVRAFIQTIAPGASDQD
jgi:hypothetical protein